MSMVKPICLTCGSDEISCDANVIWDIPNQEWIFAGCLDTYYCEKCDEETLIEYIEVKGD